MPLFFFPFQWIEGEENILIKFHRVDNKNRFFQMSCHVHISIYKLKEKENKKKRTRYFSERTNKKTAHLFSWVTIIKLFGLCTCGAKEIIIIPNSIFFFLKLSILFFSLFLFFPPFLFFSLPFYLPSLLSPCFSFISNI